MSTLQQAGTTPFAMCGGSGWTLTDWFENVYLRIAGVDKYNQLAAHTIPWTDPTVTTTFQTLAKIFGTDANMVGGKAGAVATPFPDCVSQAFGPTPKAAMLYEADFVGLGHPHGEHHHPAEDRATTSSRSRRSTARPRRWCRVVTWR